MSKKRRNYGFIQDNTNNEEMKDIPVVPSQGEQQNPDTPAEEPKKGIFSKIGVGVKTVGKKALPVAVKVGKTIAFGSIVAGAYLLGKAKASGGNDADEDIVEDDSVEEEDDE